ncbi:hypothetical protein A3H09_00870 [Candidatus Falkowbacteria bacterium RIFCSPLOWO2_12_FULL_45_13]|uniref:Uncharacterized protein n=1 Tax=Candidatus Falkowbacteria bacterium RIFCSPLOWO2_12_FULL_45_13 TaxID=1797991 RepID=A0A1F5SUX3_9BACT|nr:MAG: hypothetical protein A3H09_00870 [Candidatus Falkowbacteria bacterium RIFCSPLOWO2_12_FULL_45_13]
MMDYYYTHPRFKEEVLIAMKDFFDRPDLKPGAKLEMGKFDGVLFNEWFSYDFIFKDGKAMPEKYYYDNPRKLPRHTLKIYEYLQDNFYSLFKILEVNMGYNMLLKNLRDDKEYRVMEYKATLTARPGFVLANRLAMIGDHYEMIGCDTPYLDDSNFNGDIEIVIRRLTKSKDKLTPKDTRKIFNR